MRNLSYRFTCVASTDINSIWESIAQNNSDAADRFIHKLYEQVEMLARFPQAGHRREDLAGDRPLLFLPVGRYMIAYQAQNQSLVVVRVLHSARNLSEILAQGLEDS
jgi:toxin ParE1/3/4